MKAAKRSANGELHGVQDHCTLAFTREQYAHDYHRQMSETERAKYRVMHIEGHNALAIANNTFLLINIAQLQARVTGEFAALHREDLAKYIQTTLGRSGSVMPTYH
jgi:hypothetical protein